MRIGTRRMLVGAVIALAGCGTKGDPGTNGTNGAPGATGGVGATGATGPTGDPGTNGTNGVTGGKLTLTIDGIVTEADLSKSTMTVTIRPAANVCPGGVCNDKLDTAVIGKKAFYAQELNATNGFDTGKNISYSVAKFKGITADGNGAQYTITATPRAPATALTFAPESSTSAFAYAYVTGLAAITPSADYYLPTTVASASKVFGTVDYTSAANVAGCEKCHGAPYSKHGYRQATVAGLDDFVACKACHTDQRKGGHTDWYMTADDPANFPGKDNMTDEQKAKYAYTANIMNDVHNTHAFEFNYPQSMANCVTCHAGKLETILTDANFKPTVCKSCHVVTGPVAPGTTASTLWGGVEGGRAPSMKAIWALPNAASAASLHTMDLYTATGDTVCNACHKAGGIGKTFAQIHKGYNEQIYAADGTRFDETIKVTVGTTAYDAATHLLTVDFTIAGTAANALVKPTIVVSLYGYDSKDFVVSGHNPYTDGTYQLEYTDGAMQRSNPTLSSNSPRLTLTPATTTAGVTSWTAVADLTMWAAMIPGTVKQVQVNVLPGIGLDQTKAIDNNQYLCVNPTTSAAAPCADAVTGSSPKPATIGPVTVNANYNPPIAAKGATVAVALSTGAVNASAYGLDIVDGKKCNACHDALATTFHNPNYGSAGPAGCRLCHWVGAPGSHLEMQSRSIDSYVHAIHRMQAFDVKNYDMTSPIDSLRYKEKIAGNYPNFAGPLNCESCHNAGKYDVPDQTKSLPGILSASSKFKAGTRSIDNVGGVIPSVITGPAERACGACHRAAFINGDDAAGLASFYAHTRVNGTTVALPSTMTSAQVATTLTNVTSYIETVLGVTTGGVFTPAAGDTAQVESCSICHATAGSQHQALFNAWRKGTVQ